LGANTGLFIVEVELPTIETTLPQCPLQLVCEITDDHDFSNYALSKKPWLVWSRRKKMSFFKEDRGK